MDQGLKERLIGAAVLAALAVWLIPWLLDGPDEPIIDERGALELPVPSGHVGELRTEVIDLSPRRDAAGASARSDEREEQAARPAASAREAGTAGSSTAATSSAPSASAEPSAASSPAAETPAEPSAGTASAAARGAAPSPSGDDARTAGAAGSAATQARTSPDPAPTPSASASASSTPARASAASTSSTSASARAPANESGDWAVQVGSFGEEENARRLADRVSTFGYSPKISTFRAGGRVMYRVRVGPHETRAAAEAAASALAAHGFVAQVVTTQ